MRFWDFLFYASFGLVVTRSVAIAGVLLVFCYLIVPSVGGMLFSGRIGPRLAIGWVMGASCRCSGCTSRCSSTCRRAPPSSARSASCSR